MWCSMCTADASWRRAPHLAPGRANPAPTVRNRDVHAWGLHCFAFLHAAGPVLSQQVPCLPRRVVQSGLDHLLGLAAVGRRRPLGFGPPAGGRWVMFMGWTCSIGRDLLKASRAETMHDAATSTSDARHTQQLQVGLDRNTSLLAAPVTAARAVILCATGRHVCACA